MCRPSHPLNLPAHHRPGDHRWHDATGLCGHAPCRPLGGQHSVGDGSVCDQRRKHDPRAGYQWLHLGIGIAWRGPVASRDGQLHRHQRCRHRRRGQPAMGVSHRLRDEYIGGTTAAEPQSDLRKWNRHWCSRQLQCHPWAITLAPMPHGTSASDNTGNGVYVSGVEQSRLEERPRAPATASPSIVGMGVVRRYRRQQRHRSEPDLLQRRPGNRPDHRRKQQSG